MEDIGWRVDEFQYPFAEQARQQRYHHCKHHGYAHGVAHIAPHFVVIAGAKCLCHGDCKAGTRPIAETHHKKHDATRGTNCRQSPYAYPSTHYRCIDNQIHLLQDIAQDKGYGKLQYAARRRTTSHAFRMRRCMRSMKQHKRKMLND